MSLDIIILAMVAAFLGFRLYSVLGKRTGHEQEPMAGSMDQRRPSKPKILIEPAVNQDEAEHDEQPHSFQYENAAEAGLRQILSADRSFDVGRFVEGASSAYRLILEAFWSGDRETLQSLCDDEIYASFSQAIDAREAEGNTLDNRLVRIEEARIVHAEYQSPVARITMRFDADIAAVVRDKDGELIAGSLSDAVETHDIWTFARELRSNDPNWLLVETDQLES